MPKFRKKPVVIEAAATGLSVSQIKAAAASGDLAVRYPKVSGRVLAKPVIEHAELARWIREGATERRTA